MKVIVDQDTCTGCELCASMCPDVYQMDGPTAKVIADPVPSDLESEAAEAADSCPVDAITVQK